MTVNFRQICNKMTVKIGEFCNKMTVTVTKKVETLQCNVSTSIREWNNFITFYLVTTNFLIAVSPSIVAFTK